MAFRKKLIIHERARLWASVLTAVKDPAQIEHPQAIKVIDRRRPRKWFSTRYELRIGPKMLTTAEIQKSRYVL